MLLNYLQDQDRLEVIKELLLATLKRLINNPITTTLRGGKIKNAKLSPQVSLGTKMIRRTIKNPDSLTSILPTNNLFVCIIKVEEVFLTHDEYP